MPDTTTTARTEPVPAAPRRQPAPPTPSRLPPLDWAAGHGPISGALSVATGAAAVAYLGDAAGMPHPLPLIVGAAGAIGHGIGHGLDRRLTGLSVLTRAGTWLAAGGWAAWAMGYGPLSWTAVASLAGLGVGIGAMASHAALHEEAVEEERIESVQREHARELNRERLAVAIEWEQRIKAVTGTRVEVIAVETWKNGAGFTLAAELPHTATWTRIKDSAQALASAARLPLGCAIHVEEGDIQGRVVLDIPTRNIMAATVEYPEDFSPLSILTGIPWGLRPTADEVTVFLREAGALVLGPPGSGKSTLVDVILAGFARCTDVLTWVIDLKGGAIGMPWVRPWLEAQGLIPPKPGSEPVPAGTLPGVDWIASTPAEALRMVGAALAIGTARQRAYQDLMDQEDTTLLPVSARIPQIMLIIDEGAELLSAARFDDQVMRDLQAGVRKVIRTLRAMGGRAVLTAVDGNVSAIGDTEIRKFSPIGVALTSAESSGNNLGKLFPRARIDTGQLTARGSGVIGATTADGFAPTPFKGWRSAPSMVRRAVIATSARRPTLDQVSADAAGAAYAERWSPERAGWLWAGRTAATTPDDRNQDTNTPTRPTPRAGGLNLSYMRNQPAPGADDADALAEQLLADIDREFGTTEEPPARSAPKPLNLSYMRSQDQDPQGVPTLLTRALTAFDGAESIHTETLAAKLGTTQETLARLLPMARVTAHKNPITIQGRQARGYKREVLADVIERITRGETTAPGEVHAWQPDTTL